MDKKALEEVLKSLSKDLTGLKVKNLSDDDGTTTGDIVNEDGEQIGTVQQIPLEKIDDKAKSHHDWMDELFEEESENPESDDDADDVASVNDKIELLKAKYPDIYAEIFE